jgi:hypothetical protein
MKRSVVLWLLSLVLVGTTSAWISAQSRPYVVTPPPQPILLSGSDVGVRVESWDGNTAIGKLVVRMNGRWVEVSGAGAFHPAGPAK